MEESPPRPILPVRQVFTASPDEAARYPVKTAYRNLVRDDITFDWFLNPGTFRSRMTDAGVK